MELKIKKIEEQVAFDTETQFFGCWTDCKTYKYSGYNKDIYKEGLGCKREVKWTMKDSFWH